MHIGIGAFHRAHQAVYIDKVNKLSDQSIKWNIEGVSLRSNTISEQLNPQDGLYTVFESDLNGSSSHIINAVSKVWFAPQDSAHVISALAGNNTKIISLTITEKGYCHDPATGKLNFHHPDIIYDLNNSSTPRTAIGYLAASLKIRFESQRAAPTILCCDNLANNGETLQTILLEFVDKIDPPLSSWIAENVPFPNTMVDRIVPATTADDIEKLAEQVGYSDLGMVKTERYSQWVIEDNFASERPQWELSGVRMVNEVSPFETAKLRLLNGAHSSLAYLGYLAGYRYVHEVMQDKLFVQFLNHLMKVEITPTISPPQGLNLISYCDELLTRFSNPDLQHRTYQIAMDGSQKLPPRLLNTIEDNLANNTNSDCLCFAVAGWLRYSMGFNMTGDLITVQDPFSEELHQIQQHHFYDIDALITQYLAFDKVFSARLRDSSYFKKRLRYWLGYILANGIPTALKTLLLEVEARMENNA